MKRLIEFIRDEPSYEKWRFRERNEPFEHLKDLVWQWKDDGGCTEENKEELSKTLGSLQRSGKLPRLQGWRFRKLMYSVGQGETVRKIPD